jgi:DNA-binding MarR family transcriptional regulator
MAQDGLIRKSCPAERKRAESVSITEKGRAVYDRWLKLCQGVEKAALEGFSESEREQVLGYLSRMYRNLSGKELE